MSNFCVKCGTKLDEGVRFCQSCGAPVSKPAQDSPAKTFQNKPAIKNPDIDARDASDAEGEVRLEGSTSVSTSLGGGPIDIIRSGVTGVFSAFKNAFKNPKALIPAIILGVIWLTIMVIHAAGKNPLPVKILSFLSFSSLGTSGNILKYIGVLLGKGIFATALFSLVANLTKKDKSQKQSPSDLFKNGLGVSLETLWSWLLGLGASFIFFLILTGGISTYSFMGGIAFAYAAAKSASNNGFINKLFTSILGKKNPKYGSGITRGMAAGFAVSAVFAIFNIRLLIPGIVLIVMSAVMLILNMKGIAVLGKKEAK